MTSTNPALDIVDLSVTFATETGPVDAVREVSLRIEPGEIVALVGESGSGKSTVAFAAMRLLSGNATATGRIEYDGIDILAPGTVTRDFRGRTAAMVFQEPATALNPLMRVGDQVAAAVRNHQPVSRAEAARQAVQLLARVGIPEPEKRARSFPFQLSGGQRQRVVIALAIANSPKVLIADEPTTALDVTVQAEILDLLRRLVAETAMAVLLVTHNMGVVADLADRVAVMRHGRIVELGATADVLLAPEAEYTRQLLAAVPRLQLEHRGGPDAARPDAEPVLSLTDVSVLYGRGASAVHALKSVSFDLRPGETLGVVGESGSGKSTAARVALGLITPAAGTVRLFGQDMGRLGTRARRRIQGELGVVLQDPVASLDPRLTVGECIAEPMRVHRGKVDDPGRRVRELLDAVQLPASVLGRSPYELSGGQRQRVSIARALTLDPRLVIADEPTSALDVSVQASVLAVLRELQDDFGFACLFVSHDLAVIQQIARRVVILLSGVVEEAGPVGETLITPHSAYTRQLLDAVPSPDPVQQRHRRELRLSRVGGMQ